MAMKQAMKTNEKPANYNEKNIGKLINTWKRFFDDWAYEQLNYHGYDYFKMGYMPFIMNISENGSTNNEVAIKAKVTKQAMSKVVKELIEHGLIKIEKHETDARASLIFLTENGKNLIRDTKKCVNSLGDEYAELVGDKNYQIMIDSMFKIVKHHESKTQNKTLRLNNL